MAAPVDVDAYIAGFPADVGGRLARLRSIIARHFVGGQEKIRYGMPAIMMDTRYGLHFAG